MLRNKAVVLLTLMAVAGTAQAAFKVGMSQAQIEQEIQRQFDSGNVEKKPLKQIIEDAYNAQLDMGLVTTALVKAGADAEAVVNEVVRIGISPDMVVSAAVRAGANRETMVKVAIAAGADPASLTTATAAGREREQGRSEYAPPFSPSGSGGAGGDGGRAK